MKTRFPPLDVWKKFPPTDHKCPKCGRALKLDHNDHYGKVVYTCTSIDDPEVFPCFYDKDAGHNPAYIDPETYIFDFGKHKGKKYEQVFQFHPNYILWCVENVKGFRLCEIDLNSLHNHASGLSIVRSAKSKKKKNMYDWGIDPDHEALMFIDEPH